MYARSAMSDLPFIGVVKVWKRERRFGFITRDRFSIEKHSNGMPRICWHAILCVGTYSSTASHGKS